MTFWAEDFRQLYPSVQTQVEGKGSSTAPPALIEGTAQLGPMSRTMKKSELEKFEKKYGFKPTRIVVALDAVVIIVNKDNPLKELSLPQVDAIFSATLKGRHPYKIADWGGIGLRWGWENRAISLYGRNSASGTYGYFKKVALFKGDYKKTVKEQPGSASVVQSVGEDRFSIGYSGIGFLTSNIKVLNIAKKMGGQSYSPLIYENILAGKYPLPKRGACLLLLCGLRWQKNRSFQKGNSLYLRIRGLFVFNKARLFGMEIFQTELHIIVEDGL